jgi:hypothetical protein
MKDSPTIQDLDEQEIEAVAGGNDELQPTAPGDSYVCRVKDGAIVAGSCVKVD